MGWPKRTDIPPPWVDTSYLGQQKDAEIAAWHFIGRGARLHAATLSGMFALCGRGPLGNVGQVWVDAEPCKECLVLARRYPVKKCQICGFVFRGDSCPKQTEYDADIGAYFHPSNAGGQHHE